MASIVPKYSLKSAFGLLLIYFALTGRSCFQRFFGPFHNVKFTIHNTKIIKILADIGVGKPYPRTMNQELIA